VLTWALLLHSKHSILIENASTKMVAYEVNLLEYMKT